MGKLLQQAKTSSTPEQNNEQDAPTCEDLQRVFGNAFLIEMLCGSGETPAREATGPMGAVSVAGATHGARNQDLSQNVLKPPTAQKPAGPMKRGLPVTDIAMGVYGAHKHLTVLNDPNASLEDKGDAAGSLPADAMSTGGGIASVVAPSSPVGPALLVGAASNAVTRLGDRRMGRPVSEGGFGTTGSSWAADVGMDVQQSLGGKTGEAAGAAATGGAAILAAVPALGDGLLGTAEGLGHFGGDGACALTDCDGAYADYLADYRASDNPLAPEAIAARESAAGQCAGERNYDVPHYVATGEQVAPRRQKELPVWDLTAPAVEPEYEEIPELGCQTPVAEDPWRLFDEQGFPKFDD